MDKRIAAAALLLLAALGIQQAGQASQGWSLEVLPGQKLPLPPIVRAWNVSITGLPGPSRPALELPPYSLIEAKQGVSIAGLSLAPTSHRAVLDIRAPNGTVRLANIKTSSAECGGGVDIRIMARSIVVQGLHAEGVGLRGCSALVRLYLRAETVRINKASLSGAVLVLNVEGGDAELANLTVERSARGSRVLLASASASLVDVSAPGASIELVPPLEDALLVGVTAGSVAVASPGGVIHIEASEVNRVYSVASTLFMNATTAGSLEAHAAKVILYGSSVGTLEARASPLVVARYSRLGQVGLSGVGRAVIAWTNITGPTGSAGPYLSIGMGAGGGFSVNETTVLLYRVTVGSRGLPSWGMPLITVSGTILEGGGDRRARIVVVASSLLAGLNRVFWGGVKAYSGNANVSITVLGSRIEGKTVLAATSAGTNTSYTVKVLDSVVTLLAPADEVSEFAVPSLVWGGKARMEIVLSRITAVPNGVFKVGEGGASGTVVLAGNEINGTIVRGSSINVTLEGPAGIGEGPVGNYYTGLASLVQDIDGDGIGDEPLPLGNGLVDPRPLAVPPRQLGPKPLLEAPLPPEEGVLPADGMIPVYSYPERPAAELEPGRAGAPGSVTLETAPAQGYLPSYAGLATVRLTAPTAVLNISEPGGPSLSLPLERPEPPGEPRVLPGGTLLLPLAPGAPRVIHVAAQAGAASWLVDALLDGERLQARVLARVSGAYSAWVSLPGDRPGDIVVIAAVAIGPGWTYSARGLAVRLVGPPPPLVMAGAGQ